MIGTVQHLSIAFFLLFFGTIIGDFEKNKNKIFNVIFLCGFLFLLSALRSTYIGTDTVAYINAFHHVLNSDKVIPQITGMESGYVLLNRFITIFTDNPRVLLVVTSAIFFIGISKFVYQYSLNIGLSIFLLFSMNYFSSSMNTIRSYIALVILLQSIKYIKNNDFIKFLIIVLIASLFHITALSFILVWFVRNVCFSIKWFLKLFIVTFGLLILFPTVLRLIFVIFPKYQNYLGGVYLDGNIEIGSVITFLMNLLILLLIYIIRKYSSNHQKIEKSQFNLNSNFMLNILTIGVMFTFLSLKFSLLARVSEYFMVFSIIAIPNIIKRVNNRNLRLLLYFMIIVTTLTIYGTILVFKPDWNRIYPYLFFWN